MSGVSDTVLSNFLGFRAWLALVTNGSGPDIALVCTYVVVPQGMFTRKSRKHQKP